MTKTLHRMWPPDHVEAVTNVLASTDWPGLSGTEIGRYLAMLGIDDVSPGDLVAAVRDFDR